MNLGFNRMGRFIGTKGSQFVVTMDWSMCTNVQFASSHSTSAPDCSRGS
jgi:hypothetical protein